MKIIGLIPARRGSKRIVGKNMALLAGKPLLQYAIEGAHLSNVFDKIIISTDDFEWGKWSSFFGVTILMRPPELCTDTAHDYQWVKHALDNFPGFDVFVILRPTSPFRTAETIRRAMIEFDPVQYEECDSTRAVEKTKAHPLKSWIIGEAFMTPFLTMNNVEVPWFDKPTQSLGDVYCQNGCIHVAWTETLKKFGNVSGERIRPFFTEGNEGIDINDAQDLLFAEWLMGRKV